MKLIDTTCTKCGANLQINANQKVMFCSYCGNKLLIDDEVQHVVYDNAEDAGYKFEKGRQKAQQEFNASRIQAVRGSSSKSKTTSKMSVSSKKNTWLWVLGWLLFFPIPLTILILRTSFTNKTKVIIIAVAWFFYLAIAMGGRGNNTSDGALDNIKSLNMSNANEITLNIGDTYSRNNVHADVRRTRDFSVDDVLFISENPDVATIDYSYDSLTTRLYYDICAVGAGDTYVYAASVDGSVESERIHVVVPESVLAESISMENEIELYLGETTTLSVAFAPTDTEDQTLTWFSSDNSIVTVTSDGLLTAVGGGEATITATTNNGVSDTCIVTVDGSSRMFNLNVSRVRDDDNNIGSEWSYSNTINAERVVNGSYPIMVGDTLIFCSCYSEEDDNPDVGENTFTYTVTENDFNNGFEVSYDVYVTENGGQNSGQSAHFIVTYTFSLS